MKINMGFSMLEILICTVIIALALIPIFSTFSSSHENTQVTLDEITATNFASEIIEAIQALPFEQIKFISNDLMMDTNGNFTPDPFEIAKARNNFPGLSFKQLPPNFTMNLMIESHPSGAANPRMKSIKLTVKWGKRNREIKLMSLKSNI